MINSITHQARCSLATVAFVCVVLACSAPSLAFEQPGSERARNETEGAERPNIVIIYSDDVGYGDVGAYGAKLIPTPNIDKLASEGLRFTDGHCSAATCTPSRFSLLTGIYGFRHNIRVLPPNAPLTITPEMFTLPQLFKGAGYQTAVIGKWHLGLGQPGTPVDWNAEVKPGPLEIGFDYSFLLPSTNDRVPCVYLENHRVVNLDNSDPLFVGKKPAGVLATEYPDGKTNRGAMTYYQSSEGHNASVINGIGRIGYQWGGKSALWNDETMADVFVEQARKYIASRSKDEPFFLYFSSQDIHVPRAPHPRFQGVTKLSYRGDAMVQLDWSTGEILKALEENGLAENTLVIFTSDNGPVYDDGYEDGTTVRTSTKEVDRGHDGSGPYRGGKYQIYEGGTRVPFIVRWPGHIEPGTSNAMISQIDLLASFAKLLNVELDEGQAGDSRNVLPALLGTDTQGLPDMVEEAGRRTALRQGPWKYIAAQGNQPAELYNLDTDVGEQDNVVDDHPELAKELDARLQTIVDSQSGIRNLVGRAQQQQQAVDIFERAYGRVMYDFNRLEAGQFDVNAESSLPDTMISGPRLHLHHLAVFLDLDSPAVTDETMKSLTGLPDLEVLHVSNTNLTAAAFAELSSLQHLKFLTLNADGIDDEVLKHVSEVESLEQLRIQNAEITDAGLRHLENLTSLRTFFYSECAVSPEAIARLQAALPKCRIEEN